MFTTDNNPTKEAKASHPNNKSQLKSWFGILFVVTFVAMATLNSCQKSYSTYTVVQSKCTGDALCVSACGHGAISVSGGKATISSSKCVGCGKCVSKCKYDAIVPSN